MTEPGGASWLTPSGDLMGWPLRHWRVPCPCVACNRYVNRGLVNPHDRTDPPSRAMCQPCSWRLLSHPETFEDQA